MQWYTAVTLYSEYFHKAMAKFTEPYGMLANSVFKDDEYLQQPERGGQGATRDAFREQVLNGVRVGEHYFVRLFPVWFEFRGNNGTMLASDKAIAAASHLRGNLQLAGLAERNMQWVVGRNPFVESLMWGEGYDYAPQYPPCRATSSVRCRWAFRAIAMPMRRIGRRRTATTGRKCGCIRWVAGSG
jgi:hypothetical protein